MTGKRAAGRIEEQEIAAQLAGRVRGPGDDGAVTLSGRCGRCGYLLGSPGHEIACGTD
jgi:hypothetical protein